MRELIVALAAVALLVVTFLREPRAPEPAPAVVTQVDVIAYIQDLKLPDLQALIEALERDLGVNAAAPVIAGTMPGITAEEQPEQTEFDVILRSYGEKKINAIKTVRKHLGLGLKEAKTLVESAPVAVAEGVSKEAAEQLKEAYEAAGCEIEIR